ncbi:MAG: epoxyqueuosine reductase QueH [Eggerthellaceae bacterium]|nr:epoxyqueuosine reductase QueH [Eggerthellaceae bacterium]
MDSADVASGSQVDESWNSGHLSSSERALQEDESGGLDSTNAATEEFVDKPWGTDHLSNCERVQQETEDRHLGGTEATSVIAAPREDRCRACYAQRLEEAAAYAQNHGFEALSTTLAVSPYQLSDVCREELQAAAARHGLACIWEDFRPYYPAATRRSRELGMYRQNYCGCAYSKVEAEEERAARKAQKAAAQQEREAELRAARAKRAERQAAFEAKQRRKREIRDSFRH